LREALNFFGTVNARQFKFNLDLACKAFGVETSKSEGVDGRSVETWYRAGRHREIADYCLEDVRATAELYEKIASTLLMFNADFKNAEERYARQRIENAAQMLIPNIPMAPLSNESAFMESVTQTSLTLASSLDQLDAAEEVVTAKHQAIVLEKLVQSERPDDELPEI
jgi:hypothetical protein